MSRDSWTHLLARRAVRPLLGTRVTPNHLTTGRLSPVVVGTAIAATGIMTGMRLRRLPMGAPRLLMQAASLIDLCAADGFHPSYGMDRVGWVTISG